MATAAAITSTSSPISSANSSTVSNTLHGSGGGATGTSSSTSSASMMSSSSRSRRSTKSQQHHGTNTSDSASKVGHSSAHGSSSSTKTTGSTSGSSDSHKTKSTSGSSSGGQSKWKDKTKGLKWKGFSGDDDQTRDRRKWNSSATSSKASGPPNLYKMKGLRWKAFVESNPISAELRSASDEDDAERRENRSRAIASNLHKMKGLRWKAFIEGSSILAEMRSISDEEDVDRRENRSRGTVMRLDRSDMGLYGLCPETDPFCAVVCDICSAVVKPQGLQKHMVNRHHSSHSHHHHHHHYHRHSNYASTSSGHSERSSADHYGTAASERSSVVEEKGIASKSSHGSPQTSAGNSGGTSSSKSKSKSTCKVKSKSAKSGGSSSHSSSATPSPSASSSSSSSSSSSACSAGATVATAAASSRDPSPAMANGSAAATVVGTSHASTPSPRAVISNSVATAQQTNHKQVKPPLAGTACFSVLPTVSQHLQSSSQSGGGGGSPAKGMIAPQHSEPMISEAAAPTHSVTSSNSNSSISSISSSSSTSLPPRRTYGRSKSSCVERKNVPVKDREYDADRHCGVVSADSTRPCTRSLTCKAHSLSLRRMVSGRSKSFDKLLADHRAAKDPPNTNSRAIPEFESSNSSSSMDMDRRSVHSVSSNSNLSVEVQASSTASSQSSASAYGVENGAKQSTPPPVTAVGGLPPTATGTGILTSHVSHSNSDSHQPESDASAAASNGRSVSSRTVSLPTGPTIPGLVAETIETVRINERQNVQINISADGNTELTSTQSSLVSATRRVNRSSSRTRRRSGGDVDDDEEPLRQARVRTRVIETDTSGIPAELLDDSKFATNIFSAESTVLKGPIRLLRDARSAKRPRIEPEHDIDMSEMSEERKLQLMVQRKVTKKNEILFRDPTKPSPSAITIPPAAQIVAEAFAEENPAATLTDAEFVMDPETSLVSVSVCGTFNPNNMQINWAPLNQHFLENTIATALSPYGIQINPLPTSGQLPAIAGTSVAASLLPDPADEGFQIHHLPPLTEEEYNQMRPEFLNGMPKPCMLGCPPGIKLEMKQEAEDENNARLATVPPILPMLKPEEIKTENIKEESIEQEGEQDAPQEDEQRREPEAEHEQQLPPTQSEQLPLSPSPPAAAAAATTPPSPSNVVQIPIVDIDELQPTTEPVADDWIESPSVALAAVPPPPSNPASEQIILPEVLLPESAPPSPEPLSLDMDEDFAMFEEADMGLIDPIPITVSAKSSSSSLSPANEKENSNYNDDDNRNQQYHSSYSDDIVYRNGTGNVRNWYYGHQPRPYHVNQFGLVKLRGSTNFKKSILCTRRFKHNRPQRRLIALNTSSNHHILKRQTSNLTTSTGTQTTSNPFFKPYNTDEGFQIHHLPPLTEDEYNQMRPEFLNGGGSSSIPGKIKLQKRSIIMHHRSNGQQQLSKTCKTLRSQIVNKLAEQLLGFKKSGGGHNNNNNSSINNNTIKQISPSSVNTAGIKSTTKLSSQQHNLPGTTTSSSSPSSLMYCNNATSPIVNNSTKAGQAGTVTGSTAQSLRKQTNGTISPHLLSNSIIQRYTTANAVALPNGSPLTTLSTGTQGGGSTIITSAVTPQNCPTVQHRGRNIIVHRQNMIAAAAAPGFGSGSKNCSGTATPSANCNQRNSGSGN